MNEETPIRSYISHGSRSMKTAKYADHANKMVRVLMHGRRKVPWGRPEIARRFNGGGASSMQFKSRRDGRNLSSLPGLKNLGRPRNPAMNGRAIFAQPNQKPKFEMMRHLTPALSPASRRRGGNVPRVLGTTGGGRGWRGNGKLKSSHCGSLSRRTGEGQGEGAGRTTNKPNKQIYRNPPGRPGLR
jgi:hypothetical protein